MMAALVPLIRDLLPMIMPSSIYIKKAPALPTDPITPVDPPLNRDSASAREAPTPDALSPTTPLAYLFPQSQQEQQPQQPPPYGFPPPPPVPAGGYYRTMTPTSVVSSAASQAKTEHTDLDGLDYTDRSAAATPLSRIRPPQSPTGLRVMNRLINRNDSMCATALELEPHTSTSIRHHGEQETIIYVIAGTLIFATRPDLGEDVVTNLVSKGDFVCIPPWTEHQLRNDTDDPASWLAMRNASVPMTVELIDWGDDEVDVDVDTD